MTMEKIVRYTLIGIIIAVFIILVGSMFLCVSLPHLSRFSRDVKEFRAGMELYRLENAVFIKGMGSCENLYLDPYTSRAYITSISGNVFLVDGTSPGTMKVVKSMKIGTMALGIDRGTDGYLYVGASSHPHDQWMTKGGSIFRVDMGLSRAVKVTGDYPSLNGIAIDKNGWCYFGSSNFNLFKPRGRVYRMKTGAGGASSKPAVFINEAGLANGLFYDRLRGVLYLSNTVEGVFTIDPQTALVKPVYYKTRLSEATDDLCVDGKGRVWMTDPGDGFLKMYDPDKKIIVRFIISGVGQTSSCRIRVEKGKSMIYVTEIKQTQSPMSKTYDGRGLVIIPLEVLDKEANRFWKEF